MSSTKRKVDIININLVLEKNKFDNDKTHQSIELRHNDTFATAIDYEEYLKQKNHELYSVGSSDDANGSSTWEDSTSSSTSEINTKRTDEKEKYKTLLQWIFDKAQITETDNPDLLIVNSKNFEFLELPWESRYDQKTPITTIRKFDVDHDPQSIEITADNKIAILVSRAEVVVGERLDPIKEGQNNEVEGMLNLIPDLIRNEIPSKFQLSEYNVIVHLTKSKLQAFNYSDYNFLHLILHATSDGYICLEQESDPEHGVLVSNNDFIDLLSVTTFKHVFLSHCYSAGILDDGRVSLAGQLLSKRITNELIGFAGGAGSDSASIFSKYFYKYLMNESDSSSVFKSYEEALTKLYLERPNTKYTPYFFTVNDTDHYLV